MPIALQLETFASDLNCRYALRPSTPIYGWWYYFMLFEGVGKTLGQVLPKFPPSSNSDVDTLLDMKVRV